MTPGPDAPHPEPHPEQGDATDPDAESVVYDESAPELPAEKHPEPSPEEEELEALEDRE